MKFRAKLIDIGCIHQFTKILSTIAKVSKTCALRFTPTQIIFTLSDRVVSSGCSLWCEINQADFFDEYRIEGKDETNEIYLEVINENLFRAMKSGQAAQAIKIKLTKRQTPCLTFEITLPSLASNLRALTHDVPVGVIPSRFWDNYQRPILPSYDISVSMPNLRTVKNIVERLKNLSGYMVISASVDGVVAFKVDTEDVTATTFFRNMAVEGVGPQSPSSTDHEGRFEARVEIQKLLTFLHAQMFNPKRVICCLVHETAAHMFLECDDLKLQLFMPAVNI